MSQGEGGGRPQKYTEEWIENEADLLVKFFQENDKVLFLREFARFREYDTTRLHEFGKSNKKFSRALERAKDIQEERYMKKAMEKDVDLAWIKYCLPRILQDRPYLKASWDQQEQVTQIQTPQVIVNKIYSKPEDDDVS